MDAKIAEIAIENAVIVKALPHATRDNASSDGLKAKIVLFFFY